MERVTTRSYIFGCFPLAFFSNRDNRCGLTTGDCSRFSVYNVKQQCMQTASIQRGTMRPMSPTRLVIAKGTELINQSAAAITTWLNKRNDFQSQICEFEVTNRLLLMVNIIALLMLIAAICVESHIIISLITAPTAAYLVSKLHNNKRGGDK